MILNAKSGICSEDCGYCGQSVKMKEKQRYALVEPDKIKAWCTGSDGGIILVHIVLS